MIEKLVALLRGGAVASVVDRAEQHPSSQKSGEMAWTQFKVRANEDGADTAFDTDVAEAATSALANSLSLHVPNAARLAASGGLYVLIRIINSPMTVNLLDVDQSVEIQTNAANALANAAAGLGDEGRKTLVDAIEAAMPAESQDAAIVDMEKPDSPRRVRDKSPLASLVFMCTTQLVAAKVAAALLLGNLARDIVLQADLGRLGAIEALWGVSRDAIDATQKTTALWAIANLVWANRANQDRCNNLLEGLLATSMDALVSREAPAPSNDREDSQAISVRARKTTIARDIVERQWFAARICAVNVIANALHYHDNNRHLVEVLPHGVEKLVGLSHPRYPTEMREAALRCLVSITSTDRGARRVLRAHDDEGDASACTVLVLAASDASAGDGSIASVRRLGGAGLANVSALAQARSAVQEAGGIDALVVLAGSADAAERDEALAALAALQDNIGGEAENRRRSMAQLRPSAGQLGAKTLVAMLRSAPDEEQPETSTDAFAAERAEQSVASAVWARQVAAEALEAKPEWLEPSNLEDVVDVGGIDALFATLTEFGDVVEHAELLGATLRGIESCARASDGKCGVGEKVAELRGIQTLVSVARAAAGNEPSVFDAVLRALVPLTLGNAPNARSLMAVGLDLLLDVAEAPEPSHEGDSRASREVAATLLRILSPLNLIVCQNCTTTNRGGLVCVYCGHPLRGDDEGS